MPIVSVRISQKQKSELLKSGKTLSESIREGISLYLKNEKKRKILQELEKLQRSNPLRTTPQREVRLIKDDRRR
jgi:hypothetical protein